MQASAYANRFLFTGREYLKELRLYDYRNRVYSAHLGRFLQTDPINFLAGDINLYRYCHNSPLNHIDPLGEWIWYAGAIAIGGLSFYLYTEYMKTSFDIADTIKRGREQELEHYASGVIPAEHALGESMYHGMPVLGEAIGEAVKNAPGTSFNPIMPDPTEGKLPLGLEAAKQLNEKSTGDGGNGRTDPVPKPEPKDPKDNDSDGDPDYKDPDDDNDGIPDDLDFNPKDPDKC